MASRTGTIRLCGRALTPETFEQLYGDLFDRMAARLGSGHVVSAEAMGAFETCGDALRDGDYAVACIAGAQCSDQLWRCRMTLAGGD